MPPIPVPPELSDNEFDRVMEEIDREMASENIKIPARELMGWIRFCEKQGCQGINNNHPTTLRVMQWFKAKYGARLAMGLSFGHSVVVVRGDLLRFHCFFFYGRVHLVCHPDLMGRSLQKVIVNNAGLCNVLNEFDGVTLPYARTLTPEERLQMLTTFATGEVYLALINDAGAQPFVVEARADVRESVEHMVHNEPQFGASKWASLQAVEKFLKAYIMQQGESFRRIHELEELVQKAKQVRLHLSNPTVLGDIQCSASVRYDGSLVTRDEAVKAHHAAISVCAEISMQLNARARQKIGLIHNGQMRLNDLSERIPYILIGRG